MNHRIFNAVTAVAGIALWMTLAGMFDKQELVKQRQQERFSKAAKEMCGNGYALVDAGGDVVCQVRKALRAGKQL